MAVRTERDTLNTLIETCRDGSRGFQLAADHVSSRDLKEFFANTALQRERFAASILSIVHSPWWLAFTAFVGGAMVWFAATGFCIMANGLYWLGAEPRLAPLPERAATPPVDARVPA